MKHTNKSAVRRVVNVFIVQMAPQSAIDVENASCVYSAIYNGYGCSIGCLFSDEDEPHKRTWDRSEITYIEDIIKNFPYAAETLGECDVKLLDALQRWHDNHLHDKYGHNQEERASLLIATISELAPKHLALVKETLKDYSIA